MTAARAREPRPPAWPARLLADLPAQGALSYADHVARHGALTLPRKKDERAGLIDEVERSGLLGRGGAGFPIGRKLRTVSAGKGKPVVVANGAEGEPASHKDALLLSRAPHLVLDGIQLAAASIEASDAHLVVHRGSAAATAVRRAVSERPAGGVAVQVHELPHRYVASEESALVHWLNGGDAKPTFTPPRPFERGVRNRPTLVNNVETLAHLAYVARHGATWFRSAGDPDEPGTLLVTVSGDVPSAGVLEVPTGAAIGDVIAAAGGDLRRSQAVLVGGYFGTWLPAAHAASVPMTHYALKAAGGALGAAILVVLGRDRCGLAETSRVVEYLAGENAGQCGPCFNGLPALAGAFTKLARGGWDERLGPHIDRWLAVVPGRGACRHPDGAMRFAASALGAFADDVAHHRSHGPCAHAPSASLLPVPRKTTEWR
ncbi:MAG TPA: NADH-ubiquinone oxidoreductase-F iron-sulfur binding region domain-containing protein [Mycobacteriales bacterium]|nr:NADH-ubiquinone oxidoreductase-F iron-sulfur binding region domain-containing protein [Mycobacteriales bacterium]